MYWGEFSVSFSTWVLEYSITDLSCRSTVEGRNHFKQPLFDTWLGYLGFELAEGRV